MVFSFAWFGLVGFRVSSFRIQAQVFRDPGPGFQVASVLKILTVASFLQVPRLLSGTWGGMFIVSQTDRKRQARPEP